MQKSNIGIVGYGVVGQATGAAFKGKNNAKIYHIDANDGNTTYRAMCKECSYIFICVPSPTTAHGECDISIVKDVLKNLKEQKYEGIVVIKSTVEPGTTKKLREEYGLKINFNPEFLSEDSAFEDAENPEILVIGGEEAKQINADCYKNNPLAILSDSTTAEMTKYFFNSFFLLKVVFANQMFDICKQVGADYGRILKAARRHKWIGGMHLDIFHKGYRGASGKCLPKDARIIANKSTLIEEAIKLNERYLYLSNMKPSYYED